MQWHPSPRLRSALAGLALLTLLAGCAAPTGQRLPAVGPVPGTYGPYGGSKGYLQTYTATFPVNDDGTLFYPHSAYTVYDTNGVKAAACLNHAGPFDQVPLVVPLPPGHYEVFARAGGLGLVRVPVEIKTTRLTVLYLERGGMPKQDEALLLNAPMSRAPDGRVIGAAP